MTKNIWGSPFSKDQKKAREPKEDKPPKEEKPKKVPRLTKTDVRLLLDCSAGSINEVVMAWTERWMTQLIRENCYPPQFARAGAYQYLLDFLGDGATAVLNTIRTDFFGKQSSAKNGGDDEDEFAFLLDVPTVE
jgi:hypothetical protein